MARAGPSAASTLLVIACPGPAGSSFKPRFLRSTRLASPSPPTRVSSVFYSSLSLLSSLRKTLRLGFFTLVESCSLSSMRSVTPYNNSRLKYPLGLTYNASQLRNSCTGINFKQTLVLIEPLKFVSTLKIPSKVFFFLPSKE